ncbi:TAXI family TRAP transporter solute-binding subunit [Magnetospirillum moscoviense]|nr:TAXI family TRAP transporter solute-binding subunit [Magnetospirillum moscoviense]
MTCLKAAMVATMVMVVAMPVAGEASEPRPMTAQVPGAAAPADQRPLVIASGEVTGYYFPAAGAVCRILNKERPQGRGCAVMPSSGSAANIASLRSGEADLAILQARAAQMAVQGREGFKEAGPFPDLRAIMSLHGETVLVLARQGAAIKALADLKGKRVNLGRPGSFQRGMAEAVIESAGLTEGDLSPAVELDLSDQAVELCEGNIDAAFFTGIHPMTEAQAAIDECDAVAIPVSIKGAEAFLKRSPWFAHAMIRKGTYESLKEDLASLQVKAVLVGTTRLSADDVSGVLKAVHANFGSFTRLHPVLKGLTKNTTAKEGLTIKPHDGADRFYTETNLR